MKFNEEEKCYIVESNIEFNSEKIIDKAIIEKAFNQTLKGFTGSNGKEKSPKNFKDLFGTNLGKLVLYDILKNERQLNTNMNTDTDNGYISLNINNTPIFINGINSYSQLLLVNEKLYKLYKNKYNRPNFVLFRLSENIEKILKNELENKLDKDGNVKEFSQKLLNLFLEQELNYDILGFITFRDIQDIEDNLVDKNDRFRGTISQGDTFRIKNIVYVKNNYYYFEANGLQPMNTLIDFYRL